MIPFFVVDRPVSLEILKGFFAEVLDCKFGILTHAFTSSNFMEKFRNFPFNTPLKYSNYKDSNEINLQISENILRFVDSGIFLKKEVPYDALFEAYEFLNADYGAIIDYLNDKERTLKSAEEALRFYRRGNWKFKLVGVAQGKTLEEYMECYESLRNMGYEYIAVGGLLKRNGSSNYVRLSCEEFLKKLLISIRETFSPDWVFTFGIYNPKRHSLLEDLGVWGADYKGWIFKYEEDYSFVLDYLNQLEIADSERNELMRLFLLYSAKKKDRSLYYSKSKEKREIFALRKEIECSLAKLNLSFQFFRFKRVRDNLKSLFENFVSSSKL